MNAIKLKKLLVKYYEGPLIEDSVSFKIRCPWHSPDNNPSCVLFLNSGMFYCHVCHGDQKKGNRGVSAYKGFQSLGMPEHRAREYFINVKHSIEFDDLLFGSLPDINTPTNFNKTYQVHTKIAQREPWPEDWGFRDLTYNTLTSSWFVDRFEPTKVLLERERLPRINFVVGGADRFKDTTIPNYVRHEVSLRLSSSVKSKAINSKDFNLNIDVQEPAPATLFGLINNRLTQDSRGIILVEGPYDCMHLYQHLYHPAIGGGFDVIALMGTPQWANVLRQIELFLLSEINAKHIPIILAFDNDKAGMKLTKTAINDLKSIYLSNIQLLGYPLSVKDPGYLSLTATVACVKQLGR